MQRPRRHPMLLAVVGGAVMLSACTGGGDVDIVPTTSAAPTTTTIVEREDDGQLVIGIYLPQTGPGASLGEPMIDAARAAIDHVNEVGGVLGNDVGVRVLDEGAATGPAALLAEGVDAIVGPASSRDALSQLSAVVQPDTGVVTCSPTATALALDGYPDRGGFFFRTVPSDSLQMVAIARRAERTGVASVAVGYLDDLYGRGLRGALTTEIRSRRRQEVAAEVGFSADQEDLSTVVTDLLADDPGLVVVLGDADDGGRLLTALDAATADDPPQVIVNDAIRAASSIQQLSPAFREHLTAVAPRSIDPNAEEVTGHFTAHTVDCVNLIALAAAEAGSDNPSDIAIWMAPVSGGGRQCTSYEACRTLQEQTPPLQIDYNGLSGPLELSTTAGDPTRGSFIQFGFDADGNEIDVRTFEAP